MTIDVFPTIAALAGATLPEHTIDGKDMTDLMVGKDQVAPHQSAYYFYYKRNELHAVMSGDGRRKLYYPHRYRSLNGRTGTNDGNPIPYDQNDLTEMELYDLFNDVQETNNVIEEHPNVVKRLEAYAEKARAELGDRLTGRKGAGVRPVGALEELGTD